MTTGKSKITPSGFFGDLFKGDFFKPQSIVSESDIEDILRFNQAVESGTPHLIALKQEMGNSSETAQNLARSANGAAVDINAIPKATKAATAGMKALSIAGNMLLSMGITLAISGIVEILDSLVHAEERASQKAGQLADEAAENAKKAEEEAQQVDELIQRYKELNEAGAVDLSDREELRKLQQDLNILLDEEETRVDLVNKGYEEQLEVLKQINAEKAKGPSEAAAVSYSAAKISRDNAHVSDTEDASFGTQWLVDWVGADLVTGYDKEAYKILNESGFKVGLDNPYGGAIGTALFGTGNMVIHLEADGAKENIQKINEALESLKNTPGYDWKNSDIYNRLYELREQYEAYNERVSEAAQLSLNEVVKAESGNIDEDVDSVASYDKYREKLIEAIKKNEEVKQLIHDGEVTDKDIEFVADQYMEKNFVDVAKKVVEHNNKIKASLSDFEEASGNIKPLGAAFKELSDNGYITVKTLGEIKDATDLSDDVWEEYEAKLLRAKVGSAEFNQVMSDLTYKILDNTFAGRDLNTLTEQQIAATLRENDVMNANAVAHDWLARAKAQKLIQDELAKGVTEDNIASLLDEADTCGITSDAFIYLVAQEIIFNSTGLSVEQQIAALRRLAAQAGLTGTALGTVLNTPHEKSAEEQKKWADENGFTVAPKKDKTGNTVYVKTSDGRKVEDWVWTDQAGNTYENVNEAALSISSKAFADALQDENPVVPKYSNKTTRDSAKEISNIQEELAEKEKKFAEDMADAWKEEHLEQLKDGLKKQKDLLNRYKKNIEISDFGLKHVSTDDFANRADLLSEKLDNLKSYGAEMRAEFDRIANIIPQTGDEATELATRIEELGSDMRDNVSAIRETIVALQTLSIEAASTLIDDRMGELRAELDNIDSRIAILNSEYKSDYRSATSVLAMDMLLPVYSEYDKKRLEKERADKAIIESEQETQDKINNIVTKSLEMQSKQNAEARAKEREKLVEDLEKARKDAKEKLAEAQKDYQGFLNENEVATSNSAQKITDTFDDLDIKLPEIDTSSVDDAVTKISKAFANIFNSFSPEFNPNVGNASGVGGIVVPQYKRVSSGYGYRTHPITGKRHLHNGTDYAASSGSPIYSYSQGTVVLAGWNGGYGNCVIVDHGDGHSTLYGHASRVSTYVGAEVKRGQKIAEVGSTGNSTGPHLHFEYRKNGSAINPANIFPSFANGTPNGNKLSNGFGIAGENYKPEILVDKATGKATYIDSPTVIDLAKTDVIGEKATAKIPKFATGTPMTNEKYLKEIKAACDAFNIPYNIALSLIDQESANGTASDTWTANSAGAVGLTQITPSALGDFKETQYKVTRDILQILKENGVDIDNSRTQDESAYRDNIWTGLANLRLIQDRYGKAYGWDQNSWANVLGWYYAGGNYKGSEGTKYAKQVLDRANKSEFVNAITPTSKEDVADSTKPSEETSTEKKQPEKSAEEQLFDKIDDFYNKAADSIGRVEKDIIIEAQEILNNKNLSDFEKSRKLYDLKYNKGIEASKIGEDIYKQVVESYNSWIASIDNGTAEWSLDIYNAYKDSFAKISDLVYEMADSAVESKRAEANSRWDLSDNWIADRNFYNDWELFNDSEVAAWERVVKWLKEEYPNELEKIKGAEQNLFRARKEAVDESISDIEDYIDARNHYDDWREHGDTELKAVRRQIEVIDDAYSQGLLSTEEYVEKLEEYSQRIYSLAQNEVNKYLSNIDRYISARNTYGDWDNFSDNEIKAIKRQLLILDEAYAENLISLEEYVEKTDEYTQKLYSVAKNNITEAISELVEDYEEMKEFEASQLESQRTLLQSYYDVVNAISDAQREINKELRASQSMYEYLNEDTRELLFNQEDYNALNEELLDIQNAATELQRQYEEDILGASEETIAEITSQYQMQYETMMKQYEVAKAELDVAKKRKKLDNVLAERNVRMFINGQWQWVANTQDVIDAQNELAEAEAEKARVEASAEQTESINKLTGQINALETDLNKVRKFWSDLQEMLEGEADEVSKALEMISNVASPELKKIIEETGGNIGAFSNDLAESITTLTTSMETAIGNENTGLGKIVTDLQKFSSAIETLTNKINNINIDADKDDEQMSVSETIAKMQANSEKWHTASESEKKALHDENVRLGESIGAKYDSSTGTWTYPTVSSSSSGSSSSSSSSGNKVQVGSDGNAPAGTKVGDVVETAGGNYLVVAPGTKGATENKTNGLWSIKIDDKKKNADGSRYTSAGLNLMGEEGFEAFISNTGRLIPINRPTIGNIGAGGIVFNREQMANLRNLWDLSNLGKISPFVSASNANGQNTVVDNSIHINGLTVGEQGNEDWINGLRRYVATHK